METTGVEEGSFPNTADNLENHQKKTLIKQAAVWFRIDGLLDRSVAAAKHLASLLVRLADLIVRMESRSARGPPDYPQETSSGISINYDRGPAPIQEPSWQAYLAKIVAVLIASGVGGLIWILSAMNSRLTAIESNQVSGTTLMIQRLDAQEKHLEAHDKQLDELNRQVLWPHKH